MPKRKDIVDRPVKYLAVGDRYLVPSWYDHDREDDGSTIEIEVIGSGQQTTDMFSRPMLRFECRRLDTGKEGAMIYGPDATVWADRTTLADARALARSLRIGPNSKRYVLRDNNGLSYDGRQYEHVLAALGRSDITPDLSTRVHTVAYAIYKSATTGRMPVALATRLAERSPYEICRLVARIANECPEHTIGGICDTWIPANHVSL